MRRKLEEPTGPTVGETERRSKKPRSNKAMNEHTLVSAACHSVPLSICKPCCGLGFCPYGPLLEDSPLVPKDREEAVEQCEDFKNLLRSGKGPCGHDLDDEIRIALKQYIDNFDSAEFPEYLCPVISQWECGQTGHICPVVFLAQLLDDEEDDRIHLAH